MSIATLLPDGKIELPEEIRRFLHLQIGNQLNFKIIQDYVVIQAIDLPVSSLQLSLTRPNLTKAMSESNSFPPTTLDEIAGSVSYHGIPKTLADMEQAIEQGVLERYGRS